MHEKNIVTSHGAVRKKRETGETNQGTSKRAVIKANHRVKGENKNWKCKVALQRYIHSYGSTLLRCLIFPSLGRPYSWLRGTRVVEGDVVNVCSFTSSPHYWHGRHGRERMQATAVSRKAAVTITKSKTFPLRFIFTGPGWAVLHFWQADYALDTCVPLPATRFITQLHNH